MKIIIAKNSPLSIYEQIVAQIKNAVVKGELSVGGMVPSIRNLARDLGVSVITTKRAYEELENDGVIESMAGKGFYVCDMNREMLHEEQVVTIEKQFEQLIGEAKRTGMELEDILDMVRVLYE